MTTAEESVLQTPVQLCQALPEFASLLNLYRDSKPPRVLEIGTAAGGTLFHWVQNAQPGTLVVTVDLPPEHNPYGAPTKEMINEWCSPEVSVLTVSGNSHDNRVLEEVSKYAPYQWLFIDGAHDYESARADWDFYSPLVEHGFVCLHDIALVRAYADGSPPAGVWRLWSELRQAGFWTREYRKHVDEYGIGVVRVQ